MLQYIKILTIIGLATLLEGAGLVIIALMLVLVKCYDNKMVKATPHLFHPFVDSALGS